MTETKPVWRFKDLLVAWQLPLKVESDSPTARVQKGQIAGSLPPARVFEFTVKEAPSREFLSSGSKRNSGLWLKDSIT